MTAAARFEGIGSGSAVDRDFRAAIDDGVVARAGDGGIRSPGAIDHVVARTADQDVRAAVADERVVSCRRTGQIADVDQRVAVGETAGPQARGQIDINADRGAAVVDGIDATIADEGIAAAAAKERVVACSARQPVGMSRALDIGEVLQDVSPSA